MPRLLDHPKCSPTCRPFSVCTHHDLFRVNFELHLALLDTLIIFPFIILKKVLAPDFGIFTTRLFFKDVDVTTLWFLRVSLTVDFTGLESDYLIVYEDLR